MSDTPKVLEPPLLTSRILVFSDFNCPYCFTLNEWLSELGASNRVRWVGIEHKPALPISGENHPDDLMTLKREVLDVIKRAPEVGVKSPDHWINSHQALLYQNAIEDDEPELAPQLRQAIFRAYWQGDQQISDVKVLSRLLSDLNLSTPEVEPEYLQELTDWWSKHLDRIPCMIATTGVTHLGLQDKSAVRTFLNSALHQTEAGPGCL